MMMNNLRNTKKTILAVVCGVFLYVNLKAQTSDFGIWTNAGVLKKMGHFNLSFDAEMRCKENASAIDRWSLKFEGSYRFNKFLETGAAYQFIDFNDSKYSDYQLRHRSYVFIQGKIIAGEFSLSFRQRAQYTTKDESDRIKSSGKTDTYRVNPDVSWRSRIKLSYHTPGFFINPSLSVESFYQFNEPEGSQFDKLRYTLSLNYRKRHHEVEIYGLIDNEINVTDPVRTYVTGISYLFYF